MQPQPNTVLHIARVNLDQNWPQKSREILAEATNRTLEELDAELLPPFVRAVERCFAPALAGIWSKYAYNGSFGFGPGSKNGISVEDLPEPLKSLNLDNCLTFDALVTALQDGGWDKDGHAITHWDFTKDGWICKVTGPDAQAYFYQNHAD